MRRAPRESAGLVIVAATVVLVAASVLAAGLGGGALWMFEVLAATGVLVGLGVAFGAFDGGLSLPRRRRGGRGRQPLVTAELAASVEAQLRTLDPVEHRRLDLGDPWPTVVVGPTGVTVIAAAERVSALELALVREVLLEVRRVARTHPGDRPIAVRAVLVVPDGAVPEGPDGEVCVVGVRDLVGVVARGPIVPMATVTGLFASLSGHLAPDLHAGAV